MKVVFETSDYSEALIKRGLLEQSGFLVHMDNAGLGSIMPHMSLALGHRIWVPDSDFDDAVSILNDVTLSDDIPATDEPIDTCPNCGGWKVTRHRSMLWLLLFLVVDVMMAPIGGRKRVCENCGQQFNGETPELTTPIKAVFLGAVLYLLLLAFLSIA